MAYLSPAELTLFGRLQPPEQAHAIKVLQTLQQEYVQFGHSAPPALLSAALLHDVGKSRYPLRLWQRVWIVLSKALLPERVSAWAQQDPQGWARPFVVAAEHPAWGAEMAAAAGAQPEVVALISAHQDGPSDQLPEPLSDWLKRLRRADDDN